METAFIMHPICEQEKDYQYIISSAAFRRLQDKTQVFPLEKNDFVRTRLTHTIEVSTIARQLGIMIVNAKAYKYGDFDDKEINGTMQSGIYNMQPHMFRRVVQ